MRILKKKHNRSKENKNFMGKKLVIGSLMALLTMGTFAQNEKRVIKKSEMTPEQVAELQTKKMTLGLELSESQQKEIYKLNKEKAIERKTKRKEIRTLHEKGEKPTDKNSFEMKNARLDAQLAHQSEMKNILSEDQYETWKKTKKRKVHKIKKMRKHKKIKQRFKGKKRQGNKRQDRKE